MNIINKLDKDVVIKFAGQSTTFEADGFPARIVIPDHHTDQIMDNELRSFQVSDLTIHDAIVENLPDPQSDTVYIVSAEIARALVHRIDLVFPFIPIYEDYQIVAYERFARIRM